MKDKNENTQNLSGNIKKGQPFRVPENYFNTFADRLMVRIEENEQRNKKRTLYISLKPVLMMAASIAVVMLLLYVPAKKYFSSDNANLAQQNLNLDTADSASRVPATLISYFSEGQFLSAVSDMQDIEADTITSEKLGDFIASNYNDYDVIANN